MLQAGVESYQDDKLLVTVTSPVVGGEMNQIEVITVEAENLRASREKARMSSPKTLEAGKIQQLLLSKELAEKGIHEILEVYERDSTNPALALVVVVDGSPHDLLQRASKLADKPRAAFYINQLLEGNIRNNYIPETRVYDFDINYFIDGIDPVTPIIRSTENGITVIGTALYKGDKMVGTLDARMSALLLAMMNQFKKSEYIASTNDLPKVPGNQKTGIAISLNSVKTKISTSVTDEGNPKVSITLNFRTAIDEYKWDHMKDKNDHLHIESVVADQIKKDCEKIIKELIELGADPIGIGLQFRAFQNWYWKSNSWDEVYKDLEFDVTVKLKIDNAGIIN